MKVKKDKDGGYKITATIVTNEELERLDYKLENDLDNIVTQISNAVLKNRSLIVLQKIIKKQEKEIQELRHFKEEVSDIIEDAYYTAEPTYCRIKKLLGE